MIEDIVIDYLGDDTSEEQMLKKALTVWDYRLSNGGIHLGLESIFQTVVSYNFIIALRGLRRGRVLITESLMRVVEDNKNYTDKTVFKSGDNKYIQPDICYIVDDCIEEIVELKTIAGNSYKWLFSKSGSKNKLDGDYYRLKNIKNSYENINCFMLLLKRIDIEENDWGYDLLNELLDENKIAMRATVLLTIKKLKIELYEIIK